MRLNYKNVRAPHRGTQERTELISKLLQRKSDGPKLGHIVAKDLRKQTKHCFAKATPRPELSALVLELDGKRLTDEGCMAIIEGLTETLETRDGVSANKLEELHLTGNHLTTASLRALARVIELACFDLVDLDLSDNDISVKTDEEAKDWEIFLESFRGCRVLRRIDLSRNDLSGPRAFEIFDRCYCAQPPVDPTQLEELKGYTSAPETDSETNGDLTEMTNRARNMSIASQSSDLPSAIEESMSSATVLKRRAGIRAVPYIILNDTGMTDSGALYFSYMLQTHYYPQQLMCPLRPGPQATQLDEYKQRTHCWGLIYLPNDQLSDTGHRLLEKAEDSRADLTGIEEDISDLQFSASVESFVVVGAKQASSGLRRSSNASPIKRRTDDPIKKHAVALDVENYRKKIQRSLLEDMGYNSIDLWRCAIKMLTYARVVMLGQEQEEDSPLPVVDRTDPIIHMMETHMYATRMMATQAAAQEPIFSVTGVSRTPSQLQINDWSPLSHRDGKSLPYRTNIPTVLEEDDRYERNPDLPGDLPEDVWKKILVQAAGGDKILSEGQQKAVVHYARDRANRGLEKGELSKPEPVQLWFILDRMGCLAYEMKE